MHPSRRLYECYGFCGMASQLAKRARYSGPADCSAAKIHGNGGSDGLQTGEWHGIMATFTNSNNHGSKIKI